MADYIRRTADPFLDDLDAETKEMMIGALEIACESREFETDEVDSRRPLCNQRKMGKPRTLCFRALLITEIHSISLHFKSF